MRPTRHHSAQHFGMQQLVFHKENIHGMSSSRIKMSGFPGDGKVKNRRKFLTAIK
jgi:hypothetical protein